jgi:hypothetical protein
MGRLSGEPRTAFANCEITEQKTGGTFRRFAQRLVHQTYDTCRRKSRCGICRVIGEFPGFESAGLGGLGTSLDGSALVPQLGNAAIGAGLGLIDDLNYSDTIKRGYLLMTVTTSEVKGEYIYVSTVKSASYTTLVGRTITVGQAGNILYS